MSHRSLHRRKAETPWYRRRWVPAVICAIVVAGSAVTLSNASATTTPPIRTVQPGTFAGQAFDACTAPSTTTMAAWKAASPYRAIGIYIGGLNRGCTQANLTPDWVRTEVAAGWHLIPLYVGPQATCTGATAKRNLIDNASPYAQGTAAAKDAVAQAAALGLVAASGIFYDMEAYDTTNAACRAGVLGFMNGWSTWLHNVSYLSGFYSSMGSGVADQVANYSAKGYVRPDYVDFARWDLAVTVLDTGLPATAWAPHRRMKQYNGGHIETYGGVSINIDADYVDLAPLPGNKMADYNHNGWSDVLARATGAGNIRAYPGYGTFVNTAANRVVAAGFKSMDALVRIGDLNRDGNDDLVARIASNGYLYFYPGKSDGTLGARKLLSTDFKKMREITPVGDLNGDGYPDLVAAQTSNHNLYFYPGQAGSTLGKPVYLGGGWNVLSELAGVGDFNRDGHPDLVARDTAGTLWLYPGVKGKFGARKELATGFGGYRDLIGVGDFDRDGYTDLAAVQKSNGALILFRGTGSALLPGTQLAVGYGGYSPLL